MNDKSWKILEKKLPQFVTSCSTFQKAVLRREISKISPSQAETVTETAIADGQRVHNAYSYVMNLIVTQQMARTE